MKQATPHFLNNADKNKANDAFGTPDEGFDGDGCHVLSSIEDREGKRTQAESAPR